MKHLKPVLHAGCFTASKSVKQRDVAVDVLVVGEEVHNVLVGVVLLGSNAGCKHDTGPLLVPTIGAAIQDAQRDHRCPKSP